MTENTENTPKTLDLTLKQRKWIKAYIETGNATEAAMRVYDVKNRESASAIGAENLGKLRMSELMEEMGLTDVALINIGTEGMTKAVKQSVTGEVFPDYNVRRGYWETLLKVKGKLRDVTTLQQFNTGGDMTLEFFSDEGQIK
jgi:hypothetical protein